MSLACGLAGLVLLWLLLEPLVGPRIASWTVTLLLGATFLLWYVAYETDARHALTFFAAALVLYVWWPARQDLRGGRALAIGVAIGFAAAAAGRNGVLLLLPALSLLRAAFARPRREAGLLLGAGARVLLGFAVSFSLVLLFAPAGSGRGLSPLAEDLAHLRHPLLLHTLFSSRHGLLYWSPLLWASLLGFPAFLRRDRFTALALAAPLLATTWLNAAVDEWWAGPGFSNPRFASALPLLAPSLAMALAGLQEMVKRRPLAVPTGLGFAFVLWNQLLIVQYRERKIPADDTVSFAAVTAYNAKLLGRYAGTPVAWPANLVFAWQHDLPAARYDLLVGRYLFREPDSLDGPVKIADPRALSGLLAGDWSPPVACGDAVCREVQGRARVMAPLRAPEDIDLTVHAQGDGALALRVNDREVAVFPLEAQARALHARVGEALWRRELNDVSLTVSGGRALVEQVQFERANGSRPPEPGQ